MTDSPIFIVGSPRSGTGLLRDLLRAHPHLELPGESHFILPFFRAHGHPRNQRQARALARRILRYEPVRRWQLSIDPSSLAGCRSYPELVSRIYDEVLRRTGKARWGDKTPQHVEDLTTLLELFPGAKILHIYRDGRDVALSMLRQPLGPQNLYTAATVWKRFVTRGRDDGARFPGSYAEVRYETLLSQPERTMRAVCAFIDEPFTEEILRPRFLPRHYPEARIGGRGRVEVPSETEIASLNREKWKRLMAPSDRELFESVAGDLLTSLGYETEGLARPLRPWSRVFFRIDHKARWSVRKLNSRDKSLTSFFLISEAKLRSRVRAVASLVDRSARQSR